MRRIVKVMNGTAGRAGRVLAGWPEVLAVVAHPDDETCGLGAVADSLAAGGAAVHVLCFTRGEASTLNENHAELSQGRAGSVLYPMEYSERP